jgi:hypothetical protein
MHLAPGQAVTGDQPGQAVRLASIELRAIAGVTFKLIDPHYTVDPAAGKLTDGLTPADLGTPYLSHFPCLGVPYDGYHHPPS